MRKAPFLRFVLFIILGIVSYIYAPDFRVFVNIVFGGLLVVLAGIYIFYKSSLPYKHIGWISILIDLCFVFAGYSIAESREPTKLSNHIVYHDRNIEAYKICISDYWQNKSNSFKTEANIIGVYKGDQWQKVTGKIYFSVKSDSTRLKPRYKPGDILIVKGSPQLIQKNLLPGGFDYKSFSKFRRIYHQSFTTTEKIIATGEKNTAYILKSVAFDVRSNAQASLEVYLKSNQSYAMISALVLGVKDYLSDDMVKAFSDTGAMHVLAVSGLHVGIVYLLLSTLFKPWERNKSITRLLNLLAILILWLYAFVTGLSPSVLRAVLMFTVVLIGKVILRKGNVYNSLAVSAFILILYEPYLICSVGFQLSYLAVLGIVYLQPRIERWWDPPFKFLEYVWSLTCVAIAAQLSTSLIGLMYFHQFPTYFFLSNLIVIPISGFLLGLGIGVILFSNISMVAAAIGKTLDMSVEVIVYLLNKISLLPFSTIQNVYISPLDTLLFYVLGAGILAYFHYGNLKILYSTVIIFVSYTVLTLIVYPVNSQPIIQIYPLREGLITSFSSASYRKLKTIDQDKLPNIRYLTSHFLSTGTDEIELDSFSHHVPIWDGARVYVHFGKTIVVLSKAPTKRFTTPLKADVVIISNAYRGFAFNTDKWVKSPYILFEGNKIPYYWRKETARLLEKGIKFHISKVHGILEI